MNIRAVSYGFSVGQIIYKRESRFGPRIQDDLQLVYVYEGRASIRVDGTTRSLEANQATLLLPGHREYFQFSRAHTTRHGWCTANRARLDAATVDQLRNVPHALPFSPMMRQLADLALPLNGVTEPSGVALKETLIEALFHAYLDVAGFQAQPSTPLHPVVRRACDLVDEAFRRPLDLKTLAIHAGVTPAHLIRLFREHLSTTPKRYLWNVRACAAAELLRDTGLTAAEIAYQTGFANPHHFSRVFRQHHGLPPGAYRKRAWGSQPK